jgi:hypothetical protein
MCDAICDCRYGVIDGSVIPRTPVLPLTRLFQLFCAPIPMGVTRPIPVTTTRRLADSDDDDDDDDDEKHRPSLCVTGV